MGSGDGDGKAAVGLTAGEIEEVGLDDGVAAACCRSPHEVISNAARMSAATSNQPVFALGSIANDKRA
jgi:hypothetical protein